MPKCSFCGVALVKGRGKMLVKSDGRILYFDASKCQKNAAMGREPKKFKWTKKAK